jgi:hypothetical protein
VSGRLLDEVRSAIADLQAPRDEDTLDQRIDPTRLDALFRRIEIVAKGLGPAELQQLIALTGTLEAAIRDERDALAAAIRKLGANRRALRGYGHLRAHRTAQRVNRQG